MLNCVWNLLTLKRNTQQFDMSSGCCTAGSQHFAALLIHICFFSLFLTRQWKQGSRKIGINTILQQWPPCELGRMPTHKYTAYSYTANVPWAKEHSRTHPHHQFTQHLFSCPHRPFLASEAAGRVWQSQTDWRIMSGFGDSVFFI